LALLSSFDPSVRILDLEGRVRERFQLLVGRQPVMMQQFVGGETGSIVFDVRANPFSRNLPFTSIPRGVYLRESVHSRIVRELRLESDNEPRGGERPILYGPGVRWAITPSGKIAVGSGQQYEFRLVTWTGDVFRVVRKEHERAAITPDDRDFLSQQIERWFASQPSRPPFAATLRRAFTFAEYYPAFTRLLGDDSNRIWVQLPATAKYLRHADSQGMQGLRTGSATWDVFDDGGTHIATVAFPDGFELTRVRANTAFGYRMDERGVTVIEGWVVPIRRGSGTSRSKDQRTR
jgi:hypothetical protein